MSEPNQRVSISPTYDARQTGERFTVEVRERGRCLSREPTLDPFINTTIEPRGWRVALAILLRRYSVSVHVSGDPEIIEDVCELNADYLGRRSTRRAEWDEQLQSGLERFAEADNE